MQYGCPSSTPRPSNGCLKSLFSQLMSGADLDTAGVHCRGPLSSTSCHSPPPPPPRTLRRSRRSALSRSLSPRRAPVWCKSQRQTASCCAATQSLQHPELTYWAASHWSALLTRVNLSFGIVTNSTCRINLRWGPILKGEKGCLEELSMLCRMHSSIYIYTVEGNTRAT